MPSSWQRASSLRIIFRGYRSPIFPNRLVISVRKRVFGIKLELIDFEEREVLDQFQQRFESRTRPRDISSITPRC